MIKFFALILFTFSSIAFSQPTKNADIKQKFDTATNLPGWALEITCEKNSYFFMINKKN